MQAHLTPSEMEAAKEYLRRLQYIAAFTRKPEDENLAFLCETILKNAVVHEKAFAATA